MNAHTDLALFRRIASETPPYRRHIACIFVISMLAAPLTLLTPLPLAIAVDSVIGSQPLPGFLDAIVPSALSDSQNGILIFTALMFLLVAVLTQVQDLGNTLLKTYTGEKLVLNFRSKLFQQAQRLSLAYHDRVGTSDSTYRVTEDAKSLQYIAVESLISLVTAATTLAAMIYVTARIDMQLALVAIAVTPPLLLAAKHFRPRMRATSRDVKKLESGALSVVQEVLTGLRVVKAFGQEDREQERFMGRSSAGTSARIRLGLIEGGYAVLVGTIVAAGGAIVLYVGIRGVQQGRITLGELLLVMGYLSQLYAPIKTMARKAGSLQNYLASAERCFNLLDEAPEVPERASARRLDRASGAVEFREVSFAYDPERPVLEDVSFTVGAGARVGIAGATGAGKTTLMSLLARFYDPTSGADPAGWRGSPRLQGGRPAQAARDRPAGPCPVLDHDVRQHRLRAPRRHAGADRGRRPRGEHPRLHRRAARGICHAGRGTRHAALGWGAPANLARARVPEGRPDPDPG